MQLATLTKDNLIVPTELAAKLHTTLDEIAKTAGLGRDAISRKNRISNVRTQTRLRHMIEILNRVAPRFGSDLMAYAWYRSEPLPGFGGRTPMELVREGQADAVMAYISAIDAGGHA